MNTRNLTYGFEIEGVATEKTVKEIEKENPSGVIRKTDGSVRIAGYELDNAEIGTSSLARVRCNECEGSDRMFCEHGRGNTATEFNIGVFSEVPRMVDVLSAFKNGKNYISNNSCGLHIHVGQSARSREEKNLKNVFGSFRIISQLQRYAKDELCDHVKERLQGNRFCLRYHSLDDLLGRWKQQQKYQFVRNHPQGTLEFRFFSACEHKEKNVRRFFDFMLPLLEKSEVAIRKTFSLYDKPYQMAQKEVIEARENDHLRITPRGTPNFNVYREPQASPRMTLRNTPTWRMAQMLRQDSPQFYTQTTTSTDPLNWTIGSTGTASEIMRREQERRQQLRREQQEVMRRTLAPALEAMGMDENNNDDETNEEGEEGEE